MTRSGPPALSARADGRVEAAQAVPAPLMAPRLQGEVVADAYADLSLWGAGRVGRVHFTGLSGPFVLAPNQVVSSGGGAFVAQSAPVMAVRGARLTGVVPDSLEGAAAPKAPGELEGAAAPKAPGESRQSAWRDGGGLIAEQRGGDVVIAVGADEAEAERGLAVSVEAIVRESDAYVARCDVLRQADPLLRSMAMQGAHAALSSIRQDSGGGFAGLTAGEAYSIPPRTYYRDGYWTAQALLALQPDAVRAEIELLAQGVRENGEAPSGVILPGPGHQRLHDWWSDHFDSPLLFVLMLGDYARAAGDADLARRHWDKVKAVLARYLALAREGRGLPRKPRNDRDWADNVFREGHVAYDLGLWIGALDAIAAMGAAFDPSTAEAARAAAVQARAALDVALWSDKGWYADYATPGGFVEDHLTLDSLMLLRFDAVSSQTALALLAVMRDRLESRRNRDQPFGDWGVFCAFPPYQRAGDLRAKSADAWRYHNGGDWPWLDGLYAAERLRRDLAGWRYPLLRWWRACLDEGWAGAIEHYSPVYGRGSLLQAWSSLPTAVALAYRDRVLAGDPEASADGISV
jgi:glycogen debranching enzyme